MLTLKDTESEEPDRIVFGLINRKRSKRHQIDIVVGNIKDTISCHSID
jgi:hypothetical protein